MFILLSTWPIWLHQFDPEAPHTIPQLQGLNNCSTITSFVDEDDPESLPPPSKPSAAPQLSRSELQARLQRRIEELQNSSVPSPSLSKADTGSASGSSGEAHSPTLPTKDALLELGRQKRGEMRDRRRRERKETRRREKEIKAEQILLAKKRKGLLPKKDGGQHGSGNTNKGSDSRPTPRDPTEAEVPTPKKAKTVVETLAVSPKQVATQLTSSDNKSEIQPQATAEPDLAFSSLVFETGSSNPSGKSKSKNPSWTSKNPVEAKIAIERRQAYLDKLTPEARERAEESKKWEKAALQASGTKVMDDPKKLEKALKRQTKEKRKKRDAWNERTKAVEKLQEDKQKKRRDNIEKRKDQIRDKKKGGVKAKGNAKSGSSTKAPKKSVKGFWAVIQFFVP